MIYRIWHGWTTHEDAAAYETVVAGEVLPGIAAQRIDGYLGADLLRRDLAEEVEFVTILRFTSLDAVRALAGDHFEASYVPPAARAVLSRFDERAAHFEHVGAFGPLS